ncbi:MAG: TIGR02186 family protein [Pseudomonadota bacterium]
MTLRALIISLIILLAASELPARAQPTLQERIEIGLSKEAVDITSNFAGETLTIFGAIDNVDPLVQRQGRYDVFVVLTGPASNIVARRKERVFGVWMNVDNLELPQVPLSYLVASTRFPRDIAERTTLERLSLDLEHLKLIGDEFLMEAHPEFLEAVRRIKKDEALYRSFPGGVQFISQSLFKAQLELPANVPLGQHTARAYLFKQGALVAQTRTSMVIRKAGLEFAIFELSRNQGLIYGLASVLAGLIIGWLGRIVFKRD